MGYYSDKEVLADPSKNQLNDTLAVADYIHNESGLTVHIQAITSAEIDEHGNGPTLEVVKKSGKFTHLKIRY